MRDDNKKSRCRFYCAEYFFSVSFPARNEKACHNQPIDDFVHFVFPGKKTAHFLLPNYGTFFTYVLRLVEKAYYFFICSIFGESEIPTFHFHIKSIAEFFWSSVCFSSFLFIIFHDWLRSIWTERNQPRERKKRCVNLHKKQTKHNLNAVMMRSQHTHCAI